MVNSSRPTEHYCKQYKKCIFRSTVKFLLHFAKRMFSMASNMSYQQAVETRHFPARVQLLLGSANLPVITLAFHRITAGKGAFRTSASFTRRSHGHGHIRCTSSRLHTRADLRMRSYHTVKGVVSVGSMRAYSK